MLVIYQESLHDALSKKYKRKLYVMGTMATVNIYQNLSRLVLHKHKKFAMLYIICM